MDYIPTWVALTRFLCVCISRWEQRYCTQDDISEFFREDSELPSYNYLLLYSWLFSSRYSTTSWNDTELSLIVSQCFSSLTAHMYVSSATIDPSRLFSWYVRSVSTHRCSGDVRITTVRDKQWLIFTIFSVGRRLPSKRAWLPVPLVSLTLQAV